MMDRRGFLRGLIAAPAVVAAQNIMPVRLPLILRTPNVVVAGNFNNLLTLNMITKEAIRLFRQSNSFYEQLNKEWRRQLLFADGTQWPQTLRVRVAA